MLIVFIATPIIMGTIDNAIEDANDRNNSNEYEEDNNYYEEDNESNNNSSSDTITFKGFKFNKVRGYSYSEKQGMLIITNNEYVIGINPVRMDYDYAKENMDVLKSQIEQSYDGQVSSGQIETYSGRSYIIFDIISDTMSGNEVITDAGDNLIFDCALYDRNNSTSHSKLSELSKVLENVSYIGNSSDYSSDFSGGINLDNIEN